MHNLIDISTVDDRIHLDLRYATTNNICNQVLYSCARCYLHKDAAQALKKVQDRLAPRHLFLKIFDGYRPLSVQSMMWNAIQDEKYVANPAKNKGRHTRGTAVDLTLVDAQGQELEMPSGFDDLTERAHRDNVQHSARARTNMLLLQEAMQEEGFIGWPFEWWHYDLREWQDDERYPPLDVPLD